MSIIEYLTNNKESVEGILYSHKLHKYLKNTCSYDLNPFITNKLVLNIIDNNRVVNENDITLASSGLRRLQMFYDIPAIDMAAGFYDERNIGDELDGELIISIR